MPKDMPEMTEGPAPGHGAEACQGRLGGSG